MPRITAIVGPDNRPAGREQEEIFNAHSFYFAEDGQTIFQLNTAGRSEPDIHGENTRQILGKLSQTTQFTEAAAVALITQFQIAFPGILDRLEVAHPAAAGPEVVMPA